MSADAAGRKPAWLDSRYLAAMAVGLSMVVALVGHVLSGRAARARAEATGTYQAVQVPAGVILRSRLSATGSEISTGRPSDIAGFWQRTASSAGLRQEQMISVDLRDAVPVNDYCSLQAMDIRLSGAQVRQLTEFMVSAQDAWPGLVFTELSAEPSDSILNAWNVTLTATYFVRR